MIKQSNGADARSTTEIMAEARELQSRHATRVVGAMASRLRASFMGLNDKARLHEGAQIAAR